MSYTTDDWIDISIPNSTIGYELSNIGGGNAEDYHMSYNMHVIALFAATIGIPGNILTIVTLLSSPFLSGKPVNMYIIHQSFVDLFACLVSILQHTVVINPTGLHRVIKQIVCKVWLAGGLGIMCYVASGYNLVCLSFERYKAIISPLKYDKNKIKTRFPVVVTGIWLLAALSLVPMGIANKLDLDGACYMLGHLKTSTERTVMMSYALCVHVILPATTVIILYSRMIIAISHAWSSSTDSTLEASSQRRNKMNKAQKNIFGTCITLVVLYLICWLYYLATVLSFTTGLLSATNDYYYAGHVLLIVNSSVNPFVYAIRYKDFQDAFVSRCNRKKFISENSTTSITTVNNTQKVIEQ